MAGWPLRLKWTYLNCDSRWELDTTEIQSKLKNKKQKKQPKTIVKIQQSQSLEHQTTVTHYFQMEKTVNSGEVSTLPKYIQGYNKNSFRKPQNIQELSKNLSNLVFMTPQ